MALKTTVPRLKQVARRVFPAGGKARDIVISLVDRTHVREDRVFQRWIANVEEGLVAPVSGEEPQPLMTLVVPAYNTPDKYLIPLIDSIIAQRYSRWELSLVDGSTDPDRSAAIRRQASRDERIKLTKLDTNLGIAGNTNAAIDAASGEYVGFVDHDDELAPFALSEVVAALCRAPEADVLFSDEDKLSEDGRRRLVPFFKPGWSPAIFYYGNYLAHFVVARTELVRRIGGIRLGYDGAQDYDFILRLLEHNPVMCHVPRLLYHWRYAEGSAARGAHQKKGAGDAGLRALSDHVERMKIAATAERIPDHPTNYRLRYHVADWPRVHLHSGPVPDSYLTRLEELTDYPALARFGSRKELEELPDGGIVVLVDRKARPTDPTWLTELVSLALQPGIGVVAPALVDPRGRSCGVGYVGRGRHLWPYLAGEKWSRWTRSSFAVWPRNLVALGGVGVLRAALARELVAFGAELDPVSLSVAAHRHGCRNVYWPFAQMLAMGRLRPVTLPEPIDDPYLNPNLTVGPSGPFLDPTPKAPLGQ